MKKANRILFDKIKMQWDILKMSSAYIHAESKIIGEAEKGNDLTGFTQHDSVSYTSTPESFHFEVDNFGNMKHIGAKEALLEKAKEVRKQLDEAIDNDEFEKAELLQQALNAIQTKYNKL